MAPFLRLQAAAQRQQGRNQCNALRSGTYGAMTIDQTTPLAIPIRHRLSLQIDKKRERNADKPPSQYPTGICSDSYGISIFQTKLRANLPV